MADKQYDNTNRGGIWTNKRKEKDTHPDYTGSINVEGTEYWISAWKRYNPNNGEAFLSISIKRKDEQRPAASKKQTQIDDFLGAPSKLIDAPGDVLDDIPF